MDLYLRSSSIALVSNSYDFLLYVCTKNEKQKVNSAVLMVQELCC